MKTSLASSTLAILLFALAPMPAAAQQISPKALGEIGALLTEKTGRSPAQSKIASNLLFAIREARRDPILKSLPRVRTRVAFSDGDRALVDVDADVSEALLVRIEELGGEVVSHHERYGAIRARVPLHRVEALAADPHVRSIRTGGHTYTDMINTTEGDVAHEADVARATFGIDGTGIRACAVSDGVDELATVQGSGDLPATVTVLPGQAGTGTEGTALLEIMHDMAPGADLSFATGFVSQAQMATNILDLAAAGCDVVADDVFDIFEPVFQDGPIAAAIDTVAATSGVFYFSSAGNAGNLAAGTAGVWEGDYSGTTLPAAIVAPGATAHDFDGAGDNANEITLDLDEFGNEAFAFSLQWSEPQDGASSDYDLFLLSPDLTTVVDMSTTTQDGDDDPVEFIDSTGTDHVDHHLVVVKTSGADRFLHLNTHRGRLEHATDGQLFGRDGATHGFAVAAVGVPFPTVVPFDGSETVETFSSDGPRRIFFEADGSPVSRGPRGRGVPQSSVVRDKPDIAAADGVSTATPGFDPFFGTSASTPHAAAMAALMEEALEGLDADALTSAGIPPILAIRQARNLFNSAALDVDPFGFDNVSGAGIANIRLTLQNNEIFSDGFETGNTASWTNQVP